MWRKENAVTVARRVGEWDGDTGGAGESFPKNAFVVVAFNTGKRVMRIWAYDDVQGDQILEIPFADIWPEEGYWGGYPTGRFDPTNNPIVVFNNGEAKVLVKAYNGGGGNPAPLLRLRTGFIWR